jgi:choline dehydrogenase
MKRRAFINRAYGAVLAIGSSIGCKIRNTETSGVLESNTGPKDYDFIVVGSGAGGGPLAVSLANAGFKVLVVEAGSDHGRREVYRIPAFHTKSSEDPSMSWNFYVNHYSDKIQQGRDSNYVPGKGILYPRAGTLGGCTAHNAMINIYPLRKDWDDLGKIVGDSTYNSKTMRKYYQLVEREESLGKNERKKGWLPINLPSPTQVVKDRGVISMIWAAANVGSIGNCVTKPIRSLKSLLQIILNPDTNQDMSKRDTEESLVMVPLANTSKGERFGTRDHLINNRSRNLTILTNALVTKIVFDENASGEEPTAIGIQYKEGENLYSAGKTNPNPPNKLRQVLAKREVIICGGAFNTPQLLMLSGIGPKQELESLATEQKNSTYKVLVDRPGVGKNLQDRYEVGVVSQGIKPLPLTKDCTFQVSVSDPCYEDWKKGKGPYRSSGAVVGLLKKSNPNLKNPDLFIFMLPSSFKGYRPGYSKAQGQEKDKITWAIIKSHTHNNAGTVSLKSFDPLDTPSINFNYFEQGVDQNGQPYEGGKNSRVEDLEAVVNGVQHVRKIIASSDHFMDKTAIKVNDMIEPFLGRQAYFSEVYPGPQIKSRSEIREWVRNNAWGHHASCTCKMGKASDKMAVVDSKFRVIGTKGLRIVDASIFPKIPGYFIASSIYTMSERAADEIIVDAGGRRRIRV